MTEEVIVVERRFEITRHIRRKYRCKCGCIEQPDMPARLIPGGRYRSRELLSEAPAVALSLVAATAFFAISMLFMEYVPPRINVVVFAVLVVAAAWTGRATTSQLPVAEPRSADDGARPSAP